MAIQLGIEMPSFLTTNVIKKKTEPGLSFRKICQLNLPLKLLDVGFLEVVKCAGTVEDNALDASLNQGSFVGVVQQLEVWDSPVQGHRQLVLAVSLDAQSVDCLLAVTSSWRSPELAWHCCPA